MLARIPFILHMLVEAPASLSFLLSPQRQLPGASAEAELILMNYGGLLNTTVWIGLLFAFRPELDVTSYLVAVILGTYHWFPCYRAYQRLKHGIGMRGPQANTLGGPPFHLFVHAICLVALIGVGFTGIVWG